MLDVNVQPFSIVINQNLFFSNANNPHERYVILNVCTCISALIILNKDDLSSWRAKPIVTINSGTIIFGRAWMEQCWEHSPPTNVSPEPGIICGLSLLLVLFSAPRGLPPGSLQNPTFPNSNPSLENVPN